MSSQQLNLAVIQILRLDQISSTVMGKSHYQLHCNSSFWFSRVSTSLVVDLVHLFVMHFKYCFFSKLYLSFNENNECKCVSPNFMMEGKPVCF